MIQLWRIARDNGKDEPWLRENTNVFEGRLDWNQCLFGCEYWDGAWTVKFGPLSVTFWKAK